MFGTGWWRGALAAALLVLSACGGGGDNRDEVSLPQRPELPPADYRTQAQQFDDLQRSALSADYAAFASALGADNPDAVVSQLRDAFGGDPFDVYTLDAVTNARDHRRVAELRGTAGRLYLYTRLDKSAGGWNVAGYDLGRSRQSVARRL